MTHRVGFRCLDYVTLEWQKASCKQVWHQESLQIQATVNERPLFITTSPFMSVFCRQHQVYLPSFTRLYIARRLSCVNQPFVMSLKLMATQQHVFLFVKAPMLKPGLFHHGGSYKQRVKYIIHWDLLLIKCPYDVKHWSYYCSLQKEPLLYVCLILKGFIQFNGTTQWPLGVVMFSQHVLRYTWSIRYKWTEVNFLGCQLLRNEWYHISHFACFFKIRSMAKLYLCDITRGNKKSQVPVDTFTKVVVLGFSFLST